MFHNEKGVLPNSHAYFNTPSNLAKSIFFYLLYVGNFYCDSNYEVKRDNHNSFLIMYIKEGEGTITYKDKVFKAKKNDVVFLNCHHSHSYTCTNWETLWIHFGGNVSTEYFQYIYNKYGAVISFENETIIPEYINKILDFYRKNQLVNEPLVSCYIQRILTDLLIGSINLKLDVSTNSPVLSTINYIQENYMHKLSLKELSNNAYLSVYYFNRLFKKETGYSPYQYITNVRINHAKSLLISSDILIKEIAFECGFNSESNFVTCFKAKTGITPGDFRITPL